MNTGLIADNITMGKSYGLDGWRLSDEGLMQCEEESSSSKLYRSNFYQDGQADRRGGEFLEELEIIPAGDRL